MEKSKLNIAHTLFVSALLALIIAFSGCLEEIQKAQSPKLVFYAEEENAFEGDEISLYFSAENADKVIISLGKEKKEYECTVKCENTIKKKLKAGAYLMQAQAINNNGSAKATAKVYVKPKETKCSDGTENNKCSQTKPYFCENNTLKENCALCGCPQGYYCENNKCMQKAYKLKKIEAEFQEVAAANSEITIKALIELDESTPKGAVYYLSINGNEPKKYFFEGKTKDEIEFKVKAPTQGFLDISIVAYTEDGKREVAGSFYKQNAIKVETESKKLQPPSNLTAFVEGTDIILSWGSVENATYYGVYKSIDANPAYVAYKLYKKVPGKETQIVLQNQEKGGHFFVVTSINAFGEESSYSEVVSAEVK